MEYIGLMVEIFFLVFGVYIYLFAIGKAKAKDPDAQKKAEAFRNANGWWLAFGIFGFGCYHANQYYCTCKTIDELKNRVD